MLRKLGPALLVVVGLFSGGVASASPLTFYTDEAAWLAAVSGFTVGTYPFDVTYSDTLVNVALTQPPPGGTCCVISTPPPVFAEFPPVIGANFTQVDITFSSQQLDVDCFYPRFCTFATDVEVDFPTPIYGFASSAIIFQETGGITFNGQGLLPPFGQEYGGFFGVVGIINSLAFSCEPCDPKNDENNDLKLGNIVVATVDEPSGFASLAIGLVLLAAASSRFRQRGYSWQR